MNPKLEFSDTCDALSFFPKSDVASLKYGATSISFLSAEHWQPSSDNNIIKSSIQKYLTGECNTLQISISSPIKSIYIIHISETCFSIKSQVSCNMLTVFSELCCPLEENKEEVIKFVNYLDRQFKNK